MHDHTVFKVLCRYLKREQRDRGGSVFLAGKLKKYVMRELPLQTNAFDCGVFVCKYAECVTRRAPIDFTQANVPSLRQSMRREIVNSKVS